MYSEKTISEARRANITEYLSANGYTLKREGKQYRVAGVTGMVVMGNFWYSHVLQRGGNAIDYVTKIEGRPFTEAVATLLGYYSPGKGNVTSLSRDERHFAFSAPQKNINNNRVVPYLVKTRGIPYDILKPHIEGGRVYESLKGHNCVFTGVDHSTGEVRYAFQRSSIPSSRIMFESSGSDKRFSFSIRGTNGILLVFESVIDLFSYMSMEPGECQKNSSWLSLGGLGSTAPDYFCKVAGARDIIFCLDNDGTADEAYKRLGKRFTSLGYRVFKHIPDFKDWNMQLLHGGYYFSPPPLPRGAPS